jgi:hypothetical protein
MGPTKPTELTPKQRKSLKAVLARPTSPAGFARRAQVISLSADGISGAEIARRLGLSAEHVCRVRALERTQMPLPLRTGRAATHTHDDTRHGVLDLYAALEVATGTVTHQCTRATSPPTSWPS